ncbi:serine-enriched protein-like [Haliotis rubra]|uniref:serine-enriched protein-like n=1 Tax=Haliotis rubra TaxID=36100 RepID=UPI001EE55256|nr:serine-enriched protein-like [Haliotis rubra]
MNRNSSRLHLVDNDFLDSESGGEASSGYESSDSSNISRDSSPAPLPLPRTSSHGQVMIFKSTAGLQDSLAFILSMPELCDVTFLVGKDRVPVHGVKAILATRSRSLYQLILHHQKQSELSKTTKNIFKKQKPSPCSNTLVIHVPDYEVETFRRFITFVHSGKVKVDVNHVVGLLCVSEEFRVPDLRTACKDFIDRCQGHGQRKKLEGTARQYLHKIPAQKLLAEPRDWEILGGLDAVVSSSQHSDGNYSKFRS